MAMDAFAFVGWHNCSQGKDQKKSAVSSDVRNFPIPQDFLYLFVLVVSVLVASVSALILLNALGNGDKAQAWITVGYFVVASLVAAVCFWRLF
jgi:hypothetical protein